MLGQQTYDVIGDRRVTVGGNAAHTVGGMSSRHVGGDEHVTVAGLQETRIDGPNTTSMDGVEIHNRGDQTLRIDGTSTTSVGSEATEEHPRVLRRGLGEVHEASKRITMRSADEELTFACGDTSITLSKAGIRLQSTHVVVKGTESVIVFGKTPATEWTDKIDVTAPSINLYTKGTSLELTSSVIKVAAAQVDIGTDPDSLEIKDVVSDRGDQEVQVEAPRRRPRAAQGQGLPARHTRAAQARSEPTPTGTIEDRRAEGRGRRRRDVVVDTSDYPTGPRLHYVPGSRTCPAPPRSSARSFA